MGKKSKGFHELLRLQKMSPKLPVAKSKAQGIKVISPQETELSSSSNFEWIASFCQTSVRSQEIRLTSIRSESYR